MGLGSTVWGSWDTDTAGAVQALSILHDKAWSLLGLDVALFHHGRGIWGALLQIPAPGLVLVQACAPTFMPAGKKDAKPLTTIIFLRLALQPPSSSASWLWDYAVGYYLLEFLLWIR